jgi:carboxylesterase
MPCVTAPVMAGAEAFSAEGGPDGVLVLHGFTGNPFSLRGVAERLADAGLTVELPLLPGHGTAVDDMLPTRWADWSGAAEAALERLAARCRTVAAVGLSMGGTLALWLAERHPELAGLVLVNPLADPPADEFLQTVRDLVAAGTETVDGIGSDIAKPDTAELSYPATPLAPALSLFEAVGQVAADLPEIRCPVLILSSRQDHVVAPASGDRVAAEVAGPVERVWLERSYHVATLDWDRDEVESRTVAFVTAVLAGAGR